MGRRVFSVVLALLLCAAGLAAVFAIELMPMVPNWMDVALGGGVALAFLLPAYLIVRPPDFRDDGDDESGGGGKGPPPPPPEPPGPHDGLPDPDWSSFDDLRKDWEGERVHSIA